jgi:hypothetical protein
MGSVEPVASVLPGVPCFLVEWYRPELRADDLDLIAAKLDATIESLRADGPPVQRVMLLALPSDEVVFGVFTAPSAADVAQACQLAGVSAERLTPGVTQPPWAEPEEVP